MSDEYSPAWSPGDDPVNPAQEPPTLEEQIALYRFMKSVSKEWTQEDDDAYWLGDKPAGADE